MVREVKPIECWWVGHAENENLCGERYEKPKDAHEYFDRLDVKFDCVYRVEYPHIVIVVVGSYYLYEWEAKFFADALVDGRMQKHFVDLAEL